MQTKIEMKNAYITYHVNLERKRSIKEWVISKIKSVSWKSQKSTKVHALSDINLTFDHGEKVGVIGLNGAGKSTMLKLISGLIKPTQGTINVEGAVQPLIEIGAGFNHEFTGRENIYLNGAMLGFSKKEIQAFEEDIIEFAELEDSIDMPVKYYSSGMTARLAFSIATNVKPEILVMDEMLSAGDFSFIDKAKNRMSNLVDNAKILVIVSHNLGLVENLCTRAIVLKKGSVVFDGNPKEAVRYYRANSTRR